MLLIAQAVTGKGGGGPYTDKATGYRVTWGRHTQNTQEWLAAEGRPGDRDSLGRVCA